VVLQTARYLVTSRLSLPPVRMDGPEHPLLRSIAECFEEEVHVPEMLELLSLLATPAADPAQAVLLVAPPDKVEGEGEGEGDPVTAADAAAPKPAAKLLQPQDIRHILQGGDAIRYGILDCFR
jgi:hypothetical protein